MENSWTKESVLQFLRENPLASLAVNGEDYPVSSLVLFYADDGFNIYFGTGRESFKAKAILKNPKVSFSCWKSGSALMQWSGRAEEVTDEKEVGERMDDVTKETRYLPDFWPPLLGIWGSDYVLFRVRTDFLRVLDLRDLHIKETAPKFINFKF